ncbi:ankyrin-2 isoform X2 [Condylostylus longicornis]|uniref:ankyrin-2 isoform X2 n=1 Tax=Condylostylus longicornis TaxID=2530218 RepID=UPI00244DCE21|nr:ankyrin-2 isoform X2 [Condylostylus longicornis]
MDIDKKIIRNPMNIEAKTILTENQIKFVLSKNNKLSAVMNNLNKSKIDGDGSSSSSSTTNSLPVNELGKMLLNYSREGNAEKIFKLIQEGAPFISDWLGMSALHFAAMCNHREVLELLLKSGHNKDTRTKVDRTAMHIAALHGHAEIIEVLLKVDCDVNARDMLRMTPLHWAVEHGHAEVVKLLLKYGADVDAICKFERTPLSIAIQTGQTELLKELQIARDLMRNKPQITDQNETETNAAVHSIMLENNEEDVFDVDNDGDIKVKDEIPSEENGDITEDYPANLSTFDMIKKLKSMMAADDSDDTILTSALQNGRQLVLTEGGKLALNNLKNKQEQNTSFENSRRTFVQNEHHKKQLALKAKPVSLKTPSKNVKILSMDAFKKMYGLTKSIKPGMHFTKLTKVANSNEIIKKKIKYDSPVPLNSSNIVSASKTAINTQIRSRLEEKEDDLSSIIEICTENDSDQEIYDTSNDSNSNIKQISDPVSSNNLSSNFMANNEDIPEICRQLQELKRSHDALKKELELTRIENEEYKMRLERLECRIDEQELKLS